MTPPVSRMLKRHGDSQFVVQWAFLLLAVLFFTKAVLSDSPIMPVEVYGEFVTSYPADWWAESLMLASGTYLLGIIINGEWRWSPLLRMVGAGWHCATLTLFTVTSQAAEFGDFFALGTGVFAIVHFVFLWWNVLDFRQSMRVDRNAPK